jgi:hypothetical protein
MSHTNLYADSYDSYDTYDADKCRREITQQPMTKLEQMQYIIATPVTQLDISLLTETFTKDEVNGIVVQKFYNGSSMDMIGEIADSIFGIYNILATLLPVATLAHIETIRSHYTDIKLLNNLLIK